MPQPNERLFLLLNRVLTLTEQEKLAWERDDSAAGFTYQYRFPEGGKVLIDSRDDDGAAPIDFVVYAKDGRELGEIDWSSGSLVPDNEWDNKLHRLYRLVQEQVERTGEALDELLNQLPEEDIPF